MKPKPSWLRRVAKLAAVFVVLAGVSLLLHRLFLFPHTFPGKFDSIPLGMAEADVLEILGNATHKPTPWSAFPYPGPVTRAVVYSRDEGREKIDVVRGDEARDLVRDVYFAHAFGRIAVEAAESDLLQRSLEKYGGMLCWVKRDAMVYLVLDQDRRVAAKYWVEVQVSSNFMRRFLSRLGL